MLAAAVASATGAAAKDLTNPLARFIAPGCYCMDDSGRWVGCDYMSFWLCVGVCVVGMYIISI